MSLPREQSAKLRWQVMRQIETDKPDLEELGSSDVNCYAVTYLEGRDLIVTDDGWKWCEDFACSCGRNKAGCDHGSLFVCYNVIKCFVHDVFVNAI